jgi:tRNA threonylcarbamoyladenosine biosynthesis protein TsaE
VHEYPTRLPIAHADLYRLDTAHDVRELGLDALRDDGKLLLVEWGQPYVEQLGGDALLLELSVEPRRAALSGTGARSREIVGALGVQLSPPE